MDIRSYAVFRFRLPLTKPVQLRRNLTITHRDGILIRIEYKGGTYGWGEASPLPGFSEERVEDIVRDLPDAITYLLQPAPDGEVRHALSAVDPRRSGSVDFAVSSAVRAARASASQRDSGTSKDDAAAPLVPVARLLQGTPVEMLKQAAGAAASGFSCIKMKVGRKMLMEEVRVVKEVRDAIGDGVAIRLDANRAWTVPQATTFCDGVADERIEFLEEPLMDPADLPELAVTTSVPLALDESVVDNLDFIDGGIVSVAVLKPTVLGETQTRNIVDRCRAAGVGPTFSCSYESAVGTFAVAQLAWMLGCRSAIGVGTHAYLKEDVTRTEIVFDRPFLRLDHLLDPVMNVNIDRLDRVGA